MPADAPTGSDLGLTGGLILWLVLIGRDAAAGPSVELFWNEEDARTHAGAYVRARWPDGEQLPIEVEELLARFNTLFSPHERVSIGQSVVQGLRQRCRLCGEPVVLDYPVDPMSWIHTDDANLLSEHTAEV